MGFGFWVLGFGLLVLGFGLWILGFGFWILGFGFWVLDFGFWVLDVEFWVLGLWGTCCRSRLQGSPRSIFGGSEVLAGGFGGPERLKASRDLEALQAPEPLKRAPGGLWGPLGAPEGPSIFNLDKSMA